MSVQNEITRIEAARNTIRTKLVELALVESAAKIDDLATAVSGIENRGAVDIEVKEGESYTVPKGYHDGSGTVKGVAGGGNYALQAKTVTPTKSQQNVTPDEGKYGLSSVTVGAIPEAYQDVTSVTAGAEDVLATKVIVDATGKVVAGNMPNNGAVSDTLDASTGNQSYTIPKGYHDGKGSVKIVIEEKTATPTEATQTIAPSTGKVLSKVTVNPIPSNYKNTDGVDTTADKVLDGEEVVTSAGKIEGTMPNNGAVTETLDTGKTSYTVPAGYHDGLGKVSITLEEKSATPTKSAQNITPTAGKVLSKVTVAPIPAAYQDVTGVTATEGAVLEGHEFVDSTGAVVEGTMLNRGKVTTTIDGLTTTSYTIPAGYHDGTGTVSLTSDIETLLAAI